MTASERKSVIGKQPTVCVMMNRLHGMAKASYWDQVYIGIFLFRSEPFLLPLLIAD